MVGEECKGKLIDKIRLVIKDLLMINCTGGEMDPMIKVFLQIAGVL